MSSPSTSDNVAPACAEAALVPDNAPPLSARLIDSVFVVSQPLAPARLAVSKPWRKGCESAPTCENVALSTLAQTNAPPQCGSATPPEPPEAPTQTCGAFPVSAGGGS